MIIYRGWGACIFVLLVVTFLGFAFLFPDNNVHQAPIIELSLFTTAIEVTVLKIYLNNKKGSLFTDKDTGKKIEIKQKHDLYFIDIKYWPYIFVAIGLFFLWVNFQQR